MRLKLLVLTATFTTGCAELMATQPRQIERIDREEVMSVSLLVDQSTETYSSVVRSSDKGALRRVALSPNVLFESSRSSLPEGVTTQGTGVRRLPVDTSSASDQPGKKTSSGPVPDAAIALLPSLSVRRPEAPAPAVAAGVANAAPGAGPGVVGLQTDVRLSSLLVDYLARKGVTVIVTAADRTWGVNVIANPSERTWGGEMACQDGACAPTWLERTILAWQRRPGARPQEDLPTLALAVRELRFDTETREVIVERHPTTKELEVRLKLRSAEEGLCPGLSTDLVMLHFSAEAVNVADGRLVARIDEHRPTLTRLQPARKFKYALAAGTSMDRKAICESIRKELLAMKEYSARAPELKAFMAEVIKTGMDPLF